jgi:hypothetical protein
MTVLTIYLYQEPKCLPIFPSLGLSSLCVAGRVLFMSAEKTMQGGAKFYRRVHDGGFPSTLLLRFNQSIRTFF